MHFAGMPIIVSDRVAPELVGHEFDPIRWTRHRSWRVWRKLCKRRRATAREKLEHRAYIFHDRIVMHPELAAAIRRNIPAEGTP